MEADMFGEEPVDTDVDRPSHLHTETFSLDADLSAFERLVVAQDVERFAEDFARAGDDHRSMGLFAEAERYANCGLQSAILECPHDHLRYGIKVRCRSRICETCGRIYEKRLKQRMVPELNKVAANKRPGYVLALLTLTVTSTRWGNRLPDRNDIERLYRETSTFLRLHYGKYQARLGPHGKVVEKKRPLTADEKAERRRLRREAKAAGLPKPSFAREDRRAWLGAGYIATLELGTDNNNAHCHAIVYGPIRRWHGLKTDWEKITGDSRGVDIRACHSTKQVSSYVLKYITKPPKTDSYHRIAAYAAMIKGTRRLRTGGIFYDALIDRSEHKSCSCLACQTRLVFRTIARVADSAGLIDLHGERRAIETDPNHPLTIHGADAWTRFQRSSALIAARMAVGLPNTCQS